MTASGARVSHRTGLPKRPDACCGSDKDAYLRFSTRFWMLFGALARRRRSFHTVFLVLVFIGFGGRTSGSSSIAEETYLCKAVMFMLFSFRLRSNKGQGDGESNPDTFGSDPKYVPEAAPAPIHPLAQCRPIQFIERMLRPFKGL